MLFEHRDGKKTATALECRCGGKEQGIPLTENDLVFVTNGSCTEGTIYGDQDHAPNGDAEVRTSGCWSLWKNIARQDPAFGHPEKFCSDISKTNWESATITTLDGRILPYIEAICQRDPRSGRVVTGGIVSCQDSSWLLSWTINRQGQFKEQDPGKVCVWVYGLFTDVPGDYIKKPMKDCTGCEITQEWLYHIGVPVDQIPQLAAHSAVCVPTMMPYITAFFMPRAKGDRPDVIPDGCVNFAFLGQFADTPPGYGVHHRILGAHRHGGRLRPAGSGPRRARGLGQRLRHPHPAGEHRLSDGWAQPAGRPARAGPDGRKASAASGAGYRGRTAAAPLQHPAARHDGINHTKSPPAAVRPRGCPGTRAGPYWNQKPL